MIGKCCWQFWLPAVFGLLLTAGAIAQEINDKRGAEKNYRQQLKRYVQLEGGYVNANLSFEKGNNAGLALRLLFSRGNSGSQAGFYFLHYRESVGDLADGWFHNDFSTGLVIHRYLLEDLRLNPLVEASLGFGRYIIPAENLPAPPPDTAAGTTRKSYLDLGIGFGMQLWHQQRVAVDLLGRAVFNLGGDAALNHVGVALAWSFSF